MLRPSHPALVTGVRRVVAAVPDFAWGPQWAGVAVAEAEGLFAQRNVRVVLLPPPASPGEEPRAVRDALDALGHGERFGGAAVGFLDQSALAVAQRAGAPVKAIGALLQRSPVALAALGRPEEGISVAELLARTARPIVGVMPDSVAMIERALESCGVAGASVVPVPTHGEKMARLADGELDAVQVYANVEPVLGPVPEHNLAVAAVADSFDVGCAQVLFAHDDVLACDERRATIRAFAQAVVEGQRRALDDPRAAAEAVVSVMGASSSSALEDYELVVRGLRRFAGPNPGEIDPDAWLSAMDALEPGSGRELTLARTCDLTFVPGAPVVARAGPSSRAIDGAGVGAQIRREARATAERCCRSYARRPRLGVVRFGESAVELHRRAEVPAKRRTSWWCIDEAGPAVGVDVELLRLSEDVTLHEALSEVSSLAHNPETDALLVELPLPPALAGQYETLAAAVPRQKRIDHVDERALGELIVAAGSPGRRADGVGLPITPAGILEALDRAGVPLEGRHCAVVGHGRLVGAPLAQMLLGRGASVVVVPETSSDQRRAELCQQADVLVSATGCPGSITEEHVRDGAVVVNVGTVFDEPLLELIPDVQRDGGKASLSLCCPGGVGPLSAAVLLRSVAERAEARLAADTSADEACAQLMPAEHSELPEGWQLGVRTTAWTCPDAAHAGRHPRHEVACIRRTFELGSFSEAAAKMGEIAARCDAAHHHPELRLHEFTKLSVSLSSVTAGGVTAKDARLAEQIDHIVHSRHRP